jgi:mannose-6-phosphate isomerase
VARLAAYIPRMRKVEKPWGHEIIWAEAASYVGKILRIKAGERLSLQYHEVKEETILISRGRMQLEHYREGEAPRILEMKPGDAFHIPPRLRHRMIAVEDTDVFEVSTPHLDDVVRLEDRYGRVPAAK